MESAAQAMTEACRANAWGVWLAGMIYFALGVMVGLSLRRPNSNR